MVEEIKKLIGDGNTKEALALFSSLTSDENHSLHYDSILLNNRFSIATIEHNRGIKLDSEFSVEVTKINISLLNFISQINESSTLPKNTFAEEKELFNEYLNNWKDFVRSSSITIDNKEFKSYQITKTLCEKILNLMYIEAIYLGRTLLWEDFETLDGLYYYKLAQAKFGINYGSEDFFAEKFRAEFIADMKTLDKNDRWDFIKNYIGYMGNENENVKDALGAIGSVYFYKINFERKESHYSAVLSKIGKYYGEFVDGYINQLDNILELISKSSKQEILKNLLNSQLNMYDYLFLLYNLLARRIKYTSVENFKNFVNFRKFIFSNEFRILMIDFPSAKEFEKEIEYALDPEGNWPL